MEMDSHEERLHTMIQDSKREAAKEEAGRRAKELREKAKEAVSPATANTPMQCSRRSCGCRSSSDINVPAAASAASAVACIEAANTTAISLVVYWK